jgi:hypothetical protein
MRISKFLLVISGLFMFSAFSVGVALAGTASGSVTVMVGSAPMPDLTAAAPSPSSATAGTPISFTSTISNIGNASTGASFYNFFQWATASGGGGTINDLSPTSMGALGVGISSTATSPAVTFPSAGTYSVRACANKTNASTFGSIAESNFNNNCSGWTNVNVGSAPLPDLTAGTVSPSSAQVGATVGFVSTISNIGSASTGASFYNFFQEASTTNGGGTVTDLAAHSMVPLAAGASGVTSESVTFSSGGTYSVRACANKTNASTFGSIAESNFNNNCSGWTNVGVVPAVPTGLNASIQTNSYQFSCDSKTINVSWSASAGATSYSLRDGSTVIYTGSTTSYSDTSLVSGSSHSFTVSAADSAGSSVYSSAVSTSVPPACTVIISPSYHQSLYLTGLSGFSQLSPASTIYKGVHGSSSSGATVNVQINQSGGAMTTSCVEALKNGSQVGTGYNVTSTTPVPQNISFSLPSYIATDALSIESLSGPCP